jgi:hypothetical protein
MNTRYRFKVALLVILGHGGHSWCAADDSAMQQLTLADLAAYREAVSGTATAADSRAGAPPVAVSFKDLWNRPELFRGHRVTVQGRIVRTFRQGSVGSFPALEEAWITSPSGDPFCIVFPRPPSNTGDENDVPTTVAAAGDRVQAHPAGRQQFGGATSIPAAGRTIRFAGTFLKMVRYAAGDGIRLAPLVVGSTPPVPLPAGSTAIPSATGDGVAAFRTISSGNGTGGGIGWRTWALGLALAAAAAGAIAWRQIRAPAWRDPTRHGNGGRLSPGPDLVLEFNEPGDER